MMDRSELRQSWTPPELPPEIPHGDMPGDKVSISEGHIQKANAIVPALLPLLWEALAQNPARRAVVSVCGGSGVGKSEIASLLTFYLNRLGVGAYTLSGDNYPHRIPFHVAKGFQIIGLIHRAGIKNGSAINGRCGDAWD